MQNIILPNFVNEAVIIPIELGGVRTYASVNEMFHCQDHELNPVGTYFVYLLHHNLGSCHFTMVPAGDKWLPITAN